MEGQWVEIKKPHVGWPLMSLTRNNIEKLGFFVHDKISSNFSFEFLFTYLVKKILIYKELI